MILAVKSGDTSVTLAIITLVGVLITAGCTVLVANIAARTHTEVRSSNGSTTAQGVEAIRAFQMAHDIDDERRFMQLYGASGLPVEQARSLARDALVTDRRVAAQAGEGTVPFPGTGDHDD